MRARLFKNLGLKILAIVFAVILWLIVMNISDDQITKEINNIPVEQVNGDVLEEKDQVYEVAKGDTVDIVVKGRRSIVSQLSASDFTAKADLSQMSITNSVQIDVQANRLGIREEIAITVLDNMMTLNLEDKVSSQFPVKVKTEGETRNGYAVGSAIANPNIITVTGPQSSVDKITDVIATVSVSGANKDISTQAVVRLYDAYGEEIVNDKLEYSTDMVDVSVTVFPTKEVDVNVEIQGEPAEGYAIENTLFQPTSVMIAGPTEDIAEISEIKIDDISVAGLESNLQKTVNLSNYLPDTVVAVGDTAEIEITVNITQTSERKLTITKKNLKLRGKQADYNYTVTVSDLYVKLSGFEDMIGEVTVEDLWPVIDVSGLYLGNNMGVPVIIKEIEGVKTEISGTVNVEVSSTDTEEE